MGQTKQMPTQFDHAESVEEIAKELIPKYHSHLVNAKIAYLFKNKEIKRGGKQVIATAEKCGPKVKALADYDFIITVAYPTYQDLTDKQKVAVVDHELEHCFVDEGDDGSAKCKIVTHDFEEFNSILRRHGLWKSDLVKMKNAVKDKVEDDDEDEEESDEDLLGLEDEDDDDEE